MKLETDPIGDDEWLLRRVPAERFRNDQTPLISPNAFEPRIKGREPDTEGISLYRAACLDHPDDVLVMVPIDKRHQTGIVRIQVSALAEPGLTARIAIDSRIRGHVVIPELNAIAYADDKAKFIPIKLRLAELASEQVIRWPQAEGESSIQ